jgi:hypothetical protein
VGEDVKLQLPNAFFARPFLRGLKQRPPNAAAPVSGRDHQPEVGDMTARRMVVARN